MFCARRHTLCDVVHDESKECLARTARRVRYQGNVASRAPPAGGRRTPRPAPANPRKGRVERPALAANPRPFPLSPEPHDRPVTPEVAGSSPVAPVLCSARNRRESGDGALSNLGARVPLLCPRPRRLGFAAWKSSGRIASFGAREDREPPRERAANAHEDDEEARAEDRVAERAGARVRVERVA